MRLTLKIRGKTSGPYAPVWWWDSLRKIRRTTMAKADVIAVLRNAADDLERGRWR